MRVAVPLLFAACAVLAACSAQPNRVNSTPPTVSYRIPNNNVAATNAEAQNYCARYSRGAIYRGVQQAAEGPVAVYSCDGVEPGAVGEAPVAPSGSTVPPGPPPATVAPAPAQ
jgi:hypothetical protein